MVKMAENKKTLFLLALSVLLVSCGGGGADTPTSAAGTSATNSGNPSPTSNAGNSSPASNTGNSSSASTAGNPPPASNPTDTTTTTTAAVDQQLKGHFEMVANQILHIRTNRVIYLPISLTEFESGTGLVDTASGSPVPPPLNIDTVSAGCNLVNDGTCGIQPPAA